MVALTLSTIYLSLALHQYLNYYWAYGDLRKQPLFGWFCTIEGALFLISSIFLFKFIFGLILFVILVFEGALLLTLPVTSILHAITGQSKVSEMLIGAQPHPIIYIAWYLVVILLGGCTAANFFVSTYGAGLTLVASIYSHLGLRIVFTVLFIIYLLSGVAHVASDFSKPIEKNHFML